MYPVPEKLRRSNEKAFVPQAISIGPHHDGRSSGYLQERKFGYLEVFPRDKFVELILMDSAFVIVLMMKSCWEKLRDENDTIIFEGYMQLEILSDLILLENQKTENIPCNVEIASPDREEVKHFVDMLSIYNRPPPLKHLQPQASNSSVVYFRSLTELYDAGVKIRRSTTKNLLEIKYHRGILETPHIWNLTENIGTFLGNLVAIEQCHCRSEKYTRFLRCPRDVELLIQHGILDCWLEDNQQAASVPFVYQSQQRNSV